MTEDLTMLEEQARKFLAGELVPHVEKWHENGIMDRSAWNKLGEIKELEATINQFDRQAMSVLDEQKRRMRDNLVAEIKNIVDLKAKSGGYSLVIDSSAVSGTGTPVVAFNANDVDITKIVLTQLNETAPANRVIPGAPAPSGEKEKK